MEFGQLRERELMPLWIDITIHRRGGEGEVMDLAIGREGKKVGHRERERERERERD